jgi:hypothetical protein
MLKRLLDWFVSHALWDAAKWLWGTGGAAMSLLVQYISGWARGHQDVAGLLVMAGVVVFFGVVALIVHRHPAGGMAPGQPAATVDPRVSIKADLIAAAPPRLWLEYRKKTSGPPPRMETLVFTKDGESTISKIEVHPLTWNIQKRYPIILYNVIGPLRNEPIECAFGAFEQIGPARRERELPDLYREMMQEHGTDIQPSLEVSYNDERGSRYSRTFQGSIDPFDRIVWEPGPVRLRESGLPAST